MKQAGRPQTVAEWRKELLSEPKAAPAEVDPRSGSQEETAPVRPVTFSELSKSAGLTLGRSDGRRALVFVGAGGVLALLALWAIGTLSQRPTPSPLASVNASPKPADPAPIVPTTQVARTTAETVAKPKADDDARSNAESERQRLALASPLEPHSRIESASLPPQ